MNKSSTNKKTQTTKKEVASEKTKKTEKPVVDSKTTDGESSSDTKDSSTKSSESGIGKSQKETISTSDVHYGYFSSVRTPAYRSGWDAIYGKNEPQKIERASVKTRKNPTKRSTIKSPITIELDIDSIPEDLRLALEDEIKIQLKPRRLNYDKMQSKGTVQWNITCKILR